MKAKYMKYREIPIMEGREVEYFSDERKDPHLTLGKIYDVISLDLPRHPDETGKLVVRCGKDNYPGLWNLSNFEIVDYNIPSDWVLDMSHLDWISLYPREFGGDFWDKFHDGDEAAEALFEQVYQRIIQS